MLMIMALTLTDLPAPVVPATRRWGIFARSIDTGRPSMSLPSASVSFDLARVKTSSAMISLR
jgi:hypothetical protein